MLGRAGLHVVFRHGISKYIIKIECSSRFLLNFVGVNEQDNVVFVRAPEREGNHHGLPLFLKFPSTDINFDGVLGTNLI